MSSTYHLIPPITHERDIFPQPITSLCFDPISDTLWSGNNSGNVVAYYTAQGVRGVTFPVGGDLGIKNIIASDSNVRAAGIASNGVGAWSKGGVNKWFYRSTSAITTFSNNSSNGPVFFACTAAQELLAINSQTGDIVRKSPAISIYTHLVNAPNVLLSGSSDGYVRSHDPRTSTSTINAIQAHASGIQGLQANGNFIYTIGLGMRQGHPFPDPLVKVYDTRTMRPLPPVPFSAGPAFIDILPKRASTIVITSSEGLINVVDASNVTNSEFHQLDVPSYITSSAISPTGTYMAFGDSDGVIHLVTAADEEATLPLNGFEGPPFEWADSPDTLPAIEWTQSTPLNSIGLPYYDTQLLSSWSSRLLPAGIVSPPPPKIPQQILNTMKTTDNVAYASLPKELRGRRNVVPSRPKKSTGRFRSGRDRRSDAEPETPIFEYDPEAVPKAYRKVEIEYSKFGVEDFDFGFYNHTHYSGLETHITNSYTNAMLQIMFYTLPIRRLAKSHITTDCQREHCLFCELGFVVRMLEDARGTNCQSSNFCKVVGVLAQNHNLIELMDYGRESTDHNYGHMIQAFHRFLVDTLSLEGNTYPYNPWLVPPPPNVSYPAAAPITQVIGVDAKNVIICTNCQAVREKGNMMHVIDMIYPRKPPTNDPSQGTDFASIIRSSLLRQTTHKATCPSCNKHLATFESQRSIASKDLPPILALNASAFSEDSHKFWRDGKHQTLLKSTVELRGQINGIDDPESILYELRGMIVQVVTKEKRSHLVALVKVPEGEDDGDLDGQSSWYLFNDFAVRNISEDEALSFSANWKVPTVIYLERVDTRERLNFTALPNEIDPSILCQDTNISSNRDKNIMKHECLKPEELPTLGTLVAIDAEFVSMQQEETEYRSDGTKKVIRPARQSLARVSVLRGGGQMEGVPFIDDHIHTSELIVDYLTEFSGIKFGDLDPHLSRYTLTPLKVVYKKLRLLVDRGCIFIGHGLSKDFRIINIFVPPDQVIDTVDLYFIKSRQRRLSLRFLAWFILKENIQTETHDSIEDALTALRLYKAYHEFESEGVFDKKLDELYKEGKQFNFKPPSIPSIPGPGTLTPRASMQNPQFAVNPANLLQTAFLPGQFAMGGIPAGFYAPAPSPYPQQNWRNR
ncbi:hypothetical protein PHLCEN_2v3677 [Hermanssonia centrifuga]|uniref:PAN2-PAN3 deadenylation complex catalytic subunit PAN2 n=1 Tax=Hermanssonia centrifuga TaxID=98765 RepID=A0A2R6QEH0_9APHY|nr:hypothetical protein PHLCEN_2v3677 [Hermanssonia centrifuga]